MVVSLRDARKRVGVFRLTEPDGMQLIQQYVQPVVTGVCGLARVVRYSFFMCTSVIIDGVTDPCLFPDKSLTYTHIQSNANGSANNKGAPSAASTRTPSRTTRSTRTTTAWCGRTRPSGSSTNDMTDRGL